MNERTLEKMCIVIQKLEVNVDKKKDIEELGRIGNKTDKIK